MKCTCIHIRPTQVIIISSLGGDKICPIFFFIRPVQIRILL